MITVPVVIESEIAGKTARSGVQYEDTIESATYYIPVTEEGKVYNEEYVSRCESKRDSDRYLLRSEKISDSNKHYPIHNVFK